MSSGDVKDVASDLAMIWTSAVRRVAYLQHVPVQDAEDSVQGALCILLKNNQPDPRAENDAALLRNCVKLAANIARNTKRKAARRHLLIQAAAANDIDHEPNLEEREWARLMLEFLERVHDRRALGCLCAHEVQGRSVRSISTELGCDEGAVYRLVALARLRARELILEAESRASAASRGLPADGAAPCQYLELKPEVRPDGSVKH